LLKNFGVRAAKKEGHNAEQICARAIQLLKKGISSVFRREDASQRIISKEKTNGEGSRQTRKNGLKGRGETHTR